jgi:predicted NAD/FAD-binding protein
MSGPPSPKTRVLIVGGGAAGMSAAYAFSQHPERFDVTLYERSSSTGGMATSLPIDKDKYGADYINDGVQGASPVFHNTYAMFQKLGFSASDVGMQVSFGKDAETEFWSNVFPSQVIDESRVLSLYAHFFVTNMMKM